MIETIEFKGQIVPKYITLGNHARFILPVAIDVCIGEGLDIGCSKPEWVLPSAKGIDIKFNDSYEAYNLPLPKNKEGYDYIFSSHCLEHLPDYVRALRYWTSMLKEGGVLFLYLPHPDSLYWMPWEMPTKRHIHQFYPEQMRQIYESLGYEKIFCSTGCDLAQSFAIFGEKNSGKFLG